MMERSQKTYRWHFRQIGDDVLTHTLHNPCANSAKGPDDFIQDICGCYFHECYCTYDIRKKYSNCYCIGGAFASITQLWPLEVRFILQCRNYENL